MMTDKEFFMEVDLDCPELKKTKEAVVNGDYYKARVEFVNHLQNRKKPVWLSLDTHADKETLCKVDQILDHIFTFSGYPPIKIGTEIGWNEDPVGDAEWAIMLNRHYHWIMLAKAFAQTKDEKYAREFVAQLLSWTQKMPVKISEHWTGGLSDNANRSLDAGIRAGLTWIPAYYYFQDSPSFGPDARIVMLKSLWEHASYLSLPKHFYPWSNWGTMETNGLMAVALMFPEFNKSSGWRELGWQRFVDIMRRQVYPDGFLKELSTSYHCIALADIGLTGILLAKLNGISIPEVYMNSLEAMYECLMYFVKPDGTAPMTNDSAVEPGRKALQRGVELFKRADFAYVYSDGREGTAPGKQSVGFPYAGIYIMRSGWDANARYLSFVCGPQGTCHEHRGNLNVDLYAYGRSLIADPGTHAYSPDKYSNFLRFSSRAHNTVIVDDSEQNWREKEAKAPLKDNWISARGFDYAEGVHSSGYEKAKDIVHQRKILFIKDEYWVISDVIKGAGIHRLDQFWHFTPGRVEVDGKQKSIRTINGDSGNIIVVPVNRKELSLRIAEGEDEPVQGWYSPLYGFKEPAPAAIYTAAGVELPAVLDTVLYPYASGDHPEISASRLPVFENGKELAPAEASGFEVNIDGKGTDCFLISHNLTTTKKIGRFAFNGQSACIRRDKSERLLRILAKDATELWDGNKEVFSSDIVLPDIEIAYAGHALKLNAARLGNFKIYAPAISEMSVNGKAVKFIRNGDFITVGVVASRYG